MFSFAWQNQASKSRLNGQPGKVIARDVAAYEMIGLVVGAHSAESDLEGKKIGEDVRLLAQVEQFGIRKEVNAEGRALLLRRKHRDLLRMGNRQRTENEAVHGTEDGDVRRNAECQRKHRCECESGFIA